MKILITFGGGSVKRNGIYDQVAEALKDHNYIEFWGIEPNPGVEMLARQSHWEESIKSTFCLL